MIMLLFLYYIVYNNNKYYVETHIKRVYIIYTYECYYGMLMKFSGPVKPVDLHITFYIQKRDAPRDTI